MKIETLVAELNEDLSRERGHMEFYLLASSTVRGLHREEFAELFADEAKGEMAHVKQFQDLIVGLCTKRNLDVPLSTHSTPAQPVSFRSPEQLVEYALRMEDEVVENYTLRIEEATKLQENGGQDAVDGKYIELFLEKQIEDSRGDADNLREIFAGL
jgi:ferritin